MIDTALLRASNIVMADAAGPSNIEIYLRMRPISGTPATYEIEHDEGRVQWHVPRHIALGMANHQKERYDFFFNHIFDTDSKQDIVFEKVAEKVVLGAMDGYNGTIFAYGQTGSGKTFTITGGAERYVDRGIIPRAISLIYSELGKRSEYTYAIRFSYLEIYNDTGIDLLNPDHETKTLEELPKVMLLEDEDNVIHLRNLSSHLAMNEEEALNLLFLGDTNRMISSTPMNMASSRSHCIFTANVEARKVGEDTVRKSKLHLVDLAGSERVSKTGVDGQILKEAKYINLSLHFLEQVIVALQERSQGKNRQHIPYRNSMMTSVLRDSLGGNCRTVMLATVSIAQDQLEETISTCRFAQRVATISNQVLLNEEIDPNLVIRRLKQEIKDLKAELLLLKGNSEDDHPLTESELRMLHQHVQNYIDDTSLEASLSFGVSMRQIRAIFQIFKGMVNDEKKRDNLVKPANVANEEEKIILDLKQNIHDLNQQIQERDNEITMLTSFIKRKAFTQMEPHEIEEKDENSNEENLPSIGCTVANHELTKKEAFEEFKRMNPSNKAIEDNKCLLRAKYQQAKHISNVVNDAREKINALKSQVQKRRIERAMQDLCGREKSEDLSAVDPIEDKLISQIENEKKQYKEGFYQLKDLKQEIESIHQFLEQSHLKFQGDFEKWFCLMNKIQKASGGNSMNDPSVVHSNSDGDYASLKACGYSNRERNDLPTEHIEVGSQIREAKHELGQGEMEPVETMKHAVKQDIRMTGNAKADADIAAFFEARNKILKWKEKQSTNH